MKMFLRVAMGLLMGLGVADTVSAQLDLFSKEQRIEFTPEWKGERFPDGRPRVADNVLARLKELTADEAWDFFAGGWLQESV